MDKVIINSYEDFEKLIGQQIGVSDYLEVLRNCINLLLMQHWIINGFMWIRNVLKWRVLIIALLFTDIWHCHCFLIYGIRLLRSIIWRWWSIMVWTRWSLDKLYCQAKVYVWKQVSILWLICVVWLKPRLNLRLRLKISQKKALEGIAIFLYYFNWE